MTTTEYIPSHSANFSDRPLPELLHYLLENLIASVSADELFLYSFDSSLGHAEALAGFPHEPDESLRPVIESHLAGSETTALLNIEGIHPSSGRMWRISHNEETLGTLVILTHLDFLNIAADHSHVQYCLIIAKLLLQQRRSQDNEIIAHTIQEIANGLSNVMSPQSVIDLVCEHLPSADLSFCGLLLYGPQQESLFGRSFSYLELQGSWSQQHGAGVGLGVRVYLDQYADLLAELHSHKIWHIPDMTTFAPRFDALLRATIKGSKIQSIVFITLEVGEQRLGELIIATQDKATFSVHELNMWLAISKLLALSVMAYVLQESKNLVQRSCAALLDSVTDGIVMVLPSTHTQGNGGASVMTVNSYFSNMFHLSEYKAQGVTLSELIHLMQLPEDVRQELTHTWLSVPLRDPSTQRGEFSMVHPDGYSVIIEWHSAPLQQSQKVMGRIFIFHDVTEDRSASSLRTNFISRMSHELRTPLTSIRGFAQVMIDDLHGQLSPLALEYAQIIFDNSRHLSSLFTDLIEIARADTGDLELNFSEIGLPELFENLIMRFQDKGIAQQKWITLDMAEALPFVRIDVNRLSQALDNLLENALQHAPPDSSIQLQTKVISSSKQLPSDAPPDIVLPCVLISVLDDGPGLSHEEARQVFHAFYRTPEARSARLPGTGLGLTTARSIVEVHRGKIWAEGRRRGRRGGRFHLTLPVT